ncbi:MAG: cyclic nucleotide-binding protein [Flavobacteriaceae bacterium]|nr:MAG: cyclic nucleotide-binding protein [Flavobacteriaceae bacterium]
MNRELELYIRRYITISEEELSVFSQYLILKTIKKKEFLLKEGTTCKARYFILEGCFRHFYIDVKGNEQIIHFGIENWWITDYASLVYQVPSKMYIQALEHTTFLELNEEDLEKLYLKVPKLERFFRIIMEKTYIAAQQRIEYMFSLTGKEFYEKFVGSNPVFAQRVPQYMLASYLGLTPEFISKIKSRS